MIVNEMKMDEWKLLSFFALMSNYDYFKIQKEGEPIFYATGIERSCGWVLKFARKFATPVYSEGELTFVSALSKTEFDCQIGDFTYHIHALHERAKNIPIREQKTWNSLLDLAEVEYINTEKSQYIKELDLLTLVVDPDLLGELTEAEEAQIKRLINIYLHGQSSAMQMCRTICFNVNLHDPRQTVYVGMYDLENNTSVSSVMVYNHNLSQSMTDAEDHKWSALRSLAQYVYEKNFS